jgi:hypothetical protein
MVLVVEDEALIRRSASAVEPAFAAEAVIAPAAHPEVGTLFSDIAILRTSGRTSPDSSELPDGGCFIANPYDDGEVISALRRMAH